MLAPVRPFALLALLAPSLVLSQIRRPPAEEEPEQTEETEAQSPSQGPDLARPPDGILPVAELARLEYGPRDRPQVEIVGNKLVVATATGLVEEHDALSGELIWKLGLPEATFFRPVVLSSNPVELFVASSSGHALRIRGSDGDLLAELDFASPLTLDPLVVGSLAIVGSPDGEVIGYEIATGSERFRVDAGETAAAFAVGNGLLVISGTERTLTAVDVDRGVVRWTFRGRAGFLAPAAFGDKGDKLYVGDDIGDFYCLDTQEGKVRFRWPTGAAIRDRPLVERDRVYVTSYGNNLYRYDAKGGAEQWRVSLPGRPASPAIRVHNRLLVFTFDGVIVEVDPDKGQIGKTWSAPGEIASAPAVLVATPPATTSQAETTTEMAAARQAEAEAETQAARAGTRAGEQAASEEPAEPTPTRTPMWFENHRIALPLRSGEVLLLGYKPPEVKPEPEKPGSTEEKPPAPARGPGPRRGSPHRGLEESPKDTLSRKRERADAQTPSSHGAELERNLHDREWSSEVLTPSENDG